MSKKLPGLLVPCVLVKHYGHVTQWTCPCHGTGVVLNPTLANLIEQGEWGAAVGMVMWRLLPESPSVPVEIWLVLQEPADFFKGSEQFEALLDAIEKALG